MKKDNYDLRSCSNPEIRKLIIKKKDSQYNYPFYVAEMEGATRKEKLPVASF